jgi:quinoprotein glucose dehydrogenase
VITTDRHIGRPEQVEPGCRVGWSTKYSPLDQIHRGNVLDLRIAWRWSSPSNELVASNSQKFRTGWWHEATPLMIGGVLYTTSPHSHAAAIDARSGATIWIHDPKSYEADGRTTQGSSTAGSPGGATAPRLASCSHR